MNVRLLAAGAAFALIAAAFVALVSGRAIGNPFAITSCSTTAACDGGANASTGQGVKGLSTGGYGVYGASTKSYGVYGMSANSYGVIGKSSSGAAGVFGDGLTNGVGLKGLSVNADAADTNTTSGYGIYAQSTNSIGSIGSSANYIGVYGVSGGSQPGVYALSASGYGLESFASGGPAVLAEATASQPALYSAGATGDALDARTGGGIGAYVVNTSGNGTDTQGSYIGVVARSPATGFPIVATDDKSNNLFYVDGSGNVYYRGTLNSFAATAAGADLPTYASKTTAPTIEESGTSRLTNGAAAVYLDPSFASAIDASRSYEVMLTPGGESRGLFVASKQARGFVVRENMGGRGAVAFDYHIYATPLGSRVRRANGAAPDAPRVIRAIPIPTHPVIHHPRQSP